MTVRQKISEWCDNALAKSDLSPYERIKEMEFI